MRIEHVNITVSDPNVSARTLIDIFDWKIRWSGPSMGGGRTVHVGAENDYLALYAPSPSDSGPRLFAKGLPLQHIGIEVDDLDATEANVLAAGLEPFSHGDYEPGRRFYFLDADGIEFEVVSYSS